MQDILSVSEKIRQDDSITRYQEHTVIPKTGSNYEKQSDIRFLLQSQDIYSHIGSSYLYLEGTFLTARNKVCTTARLSNNGLAFLFEEARFEVNSVAVDQCRNVGITSCLHNYMSLSENESTALSMYGWDPVKKYGSIVDSKGNFSAVIPLKTLIGFASDFPKVLINAQQELILRRSKSDENCYEMIAPITDANPAVPCKIDIKKIIWKVPFVTPSDEERVKLLRIVEKQVSLQIPFRTWQLFEYPKLLQSTTHSWLIRSYTPMEKPRLIAIAFQTGRREHIVKDATKFDNIQLVNLKVYLDSEPYPYDNLNLDFGANNTAILYHMYLQVLKNYRQRDNINPLFDFQTFINNFPIVFIDCSRSSERIKLGASVDLRVEFETRANVVDDTVAFCLVISDKLIEYCPFNNRVLKIS